MPEEIAYLDRSGLGLNEPFAYSCGRVCTGDAYLRISEMLLAAGIVPSVKGFHFLREAVKDGMENPLLLENMSRQMYLHLGLKFNTAAAAVEKAIRTAIETAWERGKLENINAFFYVKVFSASEKPTNREFVTLLADKFLLEYR
jgi:two-component system response regulator (stage 0 sporulation protein A)